MAVELPPRTKNDVLVTLDVWHAPSSLVHPIRHLLLRPSEPCCDVGRTSKRDADLRATAFNAYFDSAVMSRVHSRISADIDNKKLYVRDSGSLHGTYLNSEKISNQEPMHLRNGDQLTFGIPINRGRDVYQPCTVTVNMDWGSDSRGDPPLPPFPAGTEMLPLVPRRVPLSETRSQEASLSDSELSDDDSVVDTMDMMRKKLATPCTPVFPPSIRRMGQPKEPAEVVDLTDDCDGPARDDPVGDSESSPAGDRQDTASICLTDSSEDSAYGFDDEEEDEEEGEGEEDEDKGEDEDKDKEEDGYGLVDGDSCSESEAENSNEGGDDVDAESEEGEADDHEMLSENGDLDIKEADPEPQDRVFSRDSHGFPAFPPCGHLQEQTLAPTVAPSPSPPSFGSQTRPGPAMTSISSIVHHTSDGQFSSEATRLPPISRVLGKMPAHEDTGAMRQGRARTRALNDMIADLDSQHCAVDAVGVRMTESLGLRMGNTEYWEAREDNKQGKQASQQQPSNLATPYSTSVPAPQEPAAVEARLSASPLGEVDGEVEREVEGEIEGAEEKAAEEHSPEVAPAEAAEAETEPSEEAPCAPAAASAPAAAPAPDAGSEAAIAAEARKAPQGSQAPKVDGQNEVQHSKNPHSEWTESGRRFLFSPPQDSVDGRSRQPSPDLDMRSAALFVASKKAAAEALTSHKKRKAEDISTASVAEQSALENEAQAPKAQPAADDYAQAAEPAAPALAALPTTPPATSEIPEAPEARPPKRLRRVAEAVGYAALGGVALVSALIATAPSF